mmetsp:Transcript_95512/g.273975  ORF Transcript_95512/g.273975 Transcript_95512/m.273975 type:complete len:296 (+) Transcript_95512:75-962(+)
MPTRAPDAAAAFIATGPVLSPWLRSSGNVAVQPPPGVASALQGLARASATDPSGLLRVGAAAAAAGLVSIVRCQHKHRALQPVRGGRCGLFAAPQGVVAEVSAPEETKSGRQIVVEHQGTMEVILPNGTMDSMNAFMKENASTVCLQNVERIVATPQDPEVKHLYLERTDMGPFRSQMRLTAKVDVVDSGRCDINILDMEAGSVDKKTGEVTFDDANKPDFKTQNTVTWKENSGGGLKVINSSSARSVMTLPWWFPLPDAVLQKLMQLFISNVISTGMKKVNVQIEKQYATYLAK